ncbi:lysophosphatidic acid phosphatase type 6-like [Ptychodera flava]|uniref:lysophosphatidic acid phosphatase type 6-like n=1 Tax=Ptychodera flava TaxID=63121 RepID=UPI00396A08C7
MDENADGGVPVNKSPDLELVHVEIFIRHGARTTMNLIPNVESATWDKDKLFVGADEARIEYEVKSLEDGPAPFWTSEARYRTRTLQGGSYPGQLTAKGMMQLYELGERLRKEYVDEKKFLPSEFDPSVIYIRSTNIARTQESARSCLAGMYKDLLNKPKGLFVIHSEDEKKEILYPSNRHCEHLGAHTKWLSKHLDIIPGLSEERKLLQKLLDLEKEEDVNFIHIRDDLFARMSNDLPVPEQLQSKADDVEKWALEVTRAQVMGASEEDKEEVLQVSVGPLMKMISDNLRSVADGKMGAKFHVYACHDSSIIALLSAFDVFDSQWPPFAADLRFEVYKDSEGNHFLKIIYVGKELTPPNLSSPMPLDALLAQISHLAVSAEKYSGLCDVPLKWLQDAGNDSGEQSAGIGV